MKKTIVAVLLCVFTLLCGCQSAKSAKKDAGYQTLLGWGNHTCGTCAQDIGSPFWNITDDITDTSSPAETRTVNFRGKDITLTYTETVGGGLYRSSEVLHRYTSENNMFVVDIRPSDGRLISYTQQAFEITRSFVPGVPRDEEALIMSAEKDLPYLTDSKDYVFVSSEFDSESNTATAVFAKFIGDLKTSDTITLTYSQDGLASVVFGDPGAFDGVEEIEMSEEKLNAGIEYYMNDQVLGGDLEILSMSATDRFVARSTDGKLVIVSDMEFKLLNESDGSGEKNLNLGIPLVSYIE